MVRRLCAIGSILLSCACATAGQRTGPPAPQPQHLFAVEPDVRGTAQICLRVRLSAPDDPDELTDRSDCLDVGQLRFLLYGDLDLVEDNVKTWIERIRAEARPGGY
jgi:hypothetical protein